MASSPIDDFRTALKSVHAARTRPQAKLVTAEINAIVDAARPIFDAYEALIEELREGIPGGGPDWYGYDNLGNAYTGDQKNEIVAEWREASNVPADAVPLRATLGEPKKPGPRARGPVTFYTYPSPTQGIAALWVARQDDLAMLKGMVAAVVPQESGDEEDNSEEE